MVAHVDKVGADMAQLNVTVEEHILTAVDRLASDRQMSRPALVRALLDEALAADLVGRPLFAQTAMARRRGGGGRQERTDSPASSGGVHRRAQRSGAPGPAQRAGLHPVAAGLQGRGAPRHPGAEAETAAHKRRGDDRRAATGGAKGPASRAGRSVSDRTGFADEMAEPARYALRRLARIHRQRMNA